MLPAGGSSTRPRGSSRPSTLNREEAYELPALLSPLAVQRRIVVKVDGLIQPFDQLERCVDKHDEIGNELARGIHRQPLVELKSLSRFQWRGCGT